MMISISITTIIVTFIIALFSFQIVLTLCLLYLYHTGQLRIVVEYIYDTIVYALSDIIYVLSTRQSTKYLQQTINKISNNIVTTVLGNENVQLAIGYSIVVGMNMFLRQPDLDEHILLMSETLAKTQPELARMSGEDFTKIVSSFFTGMFLKNDHKRNSTSTVTSSLATANPAVATQAPTTANNSSAKPIPTTTASTIQVPSTPAKIKQQNDIVLVQNNNIPAQQQQQQTKPIISTNVTGTGSGQHQHPSTPPSLSSSSQSYSSFTDDTVVDSKTTTTTSTVIRTSSFLSFKKHQQLDENTETSTSTSTPTTTKTSTESLSIPTLGHVNYSNTGTVPSITNDEMNSQNINPIGNTTRVVVDNSNTEVEGATTSNKVPTAPNIADAIVDSLLFGLRKRK